MNHERKIGEVSGKDYLVIRDMELHVLPDEALGEVPMNPGVWYEPILRVIDRVKEAINDKIS